MNRARDAGVLATLLALAFLAALFRICDYDVWWHIRTGDLILDTGRIPRVDPFSHLVAGREWVTHSWGSDVAIALAARLGGPEGVTLAKCGVTVLLAALLWALARRAGASAGATFLAVSTVLATARFRLFERPHLATFLLLPVVLEELARSAGGRAGSGLRRRDLLLPLLFLLWVNLHGGFLLGLALFPVAIAIAAVRGALRGRGPFDAAARKLLLLLVLCAVATLLNPHGLRVHRYPFVAEQALRVIHNVEWFPPTFASFPLFFVLLGAVVLLASFHGHAAGVPRLLLLAPLAGLALRANRSIGEFAVAAAVPLALLLTRAALPARAWLRLRAPAGVGLAGAGAVLAPTLLLVLLHARGVVIPSGLYRFGLGLHEDLFPVAAADVVEDRGLVGNMANTPAFGGYLIWRFWPQRLVLTDGRVVLYREANDRLVRTPWEQTIERAGLTYAILRTEEGPGPDPLARAISSSPDWALLHWDDVATVWARRIPEHENAIRRGHYRVASPLRDPARVPAESLAVATEEYERAAESDHPFLALFGLGIVRLRAGDFPGAEEALGRASALRPGNPPAWMALAYARLSAGRPDAALPAARRAVALAPDDPLALRHLGAALFELGRYAEAEGALEKAAALLPANPELRARLRECRRRLGAP